MEPIPGGNLPPGFDSSSCRSVYVGNIHVNVTEKLLAEVFQSVGPLTGCKLIKKEKYGLLRGTLRAPAVGWMMYNILVSNEKSIQSQYKSHVYADPDNVTPGIVQSRYELTKRKRARYVLAAFLTGLLDPVSSREEFLELFVCLEGKVLVLVASSEGSPKRSKAEMQALKGGKGVSKFVEVPGALLPQEEFPTMVAEELHHFLQEIFEANP